MQKHFRTYWLSLIFIVTFACGLAYVVMHQNYRQSANDPQIQIAQDAMYGLVGGVTPDKMIPVNKVEIGNRVSPFVMIFDANKNYLAGSAVIDGKPPILPDGVLDYTKTHGENRVTWQLQSGIRIATVIKYNGTYFVLVGRNLRETENRIDSLKKQVLVSWVLGVLGSFIFLRLLAKLKVGGEWR